VNGDAFPVHPRFNSVLVLFEFGFGDFWFGFKRGVVGGGGSLMLSKLLFFWLRINGLVFTILKFLLHIIEYVDFFHFTNIGNEKET